MSININEYERISMNSYECQWILMNIFECQWILMNMNEYWWIFMNVNEYEWIFMNIHEYLSMNIYEYSWIFINEYEWILKYRWMKRLKIRRSKQESHGLSQVWCKSRTTPGRLTRGRWFHVDVRWEIHEIVGKSWGELRKTTGISYDILWYAILWLWYCFCRSTMNYVYKYKYIYIYICWDAILCI